jgi:hypothetical protein
MDLTITIIYCVCEEFSKAMGLRDDPQARLSTAEVMTIPLVASAFFGGNIEKARSFLSEYGYIKRMISKSRLNRRDSTPSTPTFGKRSSVCWPNSSRSATIEGAYVVDSLPVAACDNIRIRSCRLYPLEEGKSFRGYIPSKRRYFYGLRLHLVVSPPRLCP